jgi:hypothetical protein
MLHAILQGARGPVATAPKAGLVVVPTVYLAAVALPLLITVVAVGLRLAAAVATRIDDAAAGRSATFAAVTALRMPEIAAYAGPEVGHPDQAPAPRPGPLQLVDEAEPSTKLCPDCAETVLASARVCKHCQFRFAPPLHGSYAV